jgi:hypothetical protein
MGRTSDIPFARATSNGKIWISGAIVGMVLCASPLYSQILSRAEEAMLLHTEVSVSGVVFDPAGNPISEANVDYSVTYDAPQKIWSGTLWDRPFVTDSEGRFSLKTRAPALVIRKPGFRSARLLVQSKRSWRITLEPATREPPPCPSTSRCESVGRWRGTFCLPRISEVKAGRLAYDVDYGQRNFIIETNAGPKWMRYGIGPMWSYGMPDTEKVWTSVQYKETVYNCAGIVVVDARGIDNAGKLWRFFGTLGESVDYQDLDATEAHLFDQLIDGVCIRENK